MTVVAPNVCALLVALIAKVLENVKGFIPGTVGGVCCVIVGHPLDLVKVKMQTGAFDIMAASALYPVRIGDKPINVGTAHILRAAFAEQGFRGIYRGVSAPLAAVAPSFAISFWTYAQAKSWIARASGADPSAPVSIGHALCAGALSAIPATAIIAPSERIKCILQVQQSHASHSASMRECALRLYKEGGLKSIYKGSGATFLRDVPGNATYFAVYEYMRTLLCQLGSDNGSTSNKVSPFATMLAGGLAGMSNWIVAIPADVLKSRLQTDTRGRYESIFDVYREIMRKEGVSALYKGLAPALQRAFPANAACFLGVEFARQFL